MIWNTKANISGRERTVIARMEKCLTENDNMRVVGVSACEEEERVAGSLTFSARRVRVRCWMPAECDGTSVKGSW